MQFKFDKKMIFLAPMAGITDDAFRTICKEQGCDVICCEMVSDYAVYYNNKKTLKMLEYDKEQRPISIQIFGEDSEKMVAAAKFIETNAKPDIIDINMGCPAKKVAVSKEAGSALLKDINKVELIAKSVINSLKTPVSVKIRSGWDEQNINCVEVAQLLEKCGASFIILHPRTRSQMFIGHSDWSLIKKVKEVIKIPVVGNGDISNCYDAKKMFDETNCDGIMIGRGSYGNPWIFRQIKEYIFENKTPTEVTINDRWKTLLRHLSLLRERYDEKYAMMNIKPHISGYFSGLLNKKETVKKIVMCESYKTIIEIINNFFENYSSL